MKIGVLTFLHVANFGANLQAISTYCYLKNHGHEPMFFDYTSWQTEWTNWLSRSKRRLLGQSVPIQTVEHYRFINEIIKSQITPLHTARQISKALNSMSVDGVIIGSDAVAQHWPVFSTLKWGKHRPFWIEPLQQERRFPNPFWGCGFADHIPTAMMSVSSQNSKYQLYSKHTVKRMGKQLHLMKYISVRDAWTQDMMHTIAPELSVSITPDPVFALNQNLGDKIPTEESIRQRFKLPSHYVLVGMHSQVLSVSQLTRLNEIMKQEGNECVAFCITGKYSYTHPFDYQIPLPISPLDWFGLIKYASAYIGSNMHPIVSCLTNAVPCYSLDNWGSVNFWGQRKQAKSSKVYDVLKQYGIEGNRTSIENGVCPVSVEEIISKLHSYPVKKIKEISAQRVIAYNQMMSDILKSFQP